MNDDQQYLRDMRLVDESGLIVKQLRETFEATLSRDCRTPEITLDVERLPWKPWDRVRVTVELLPKRGKP